MSCSGDQHRFAPGSSTCDCGQTHSTLASGGLPYASWVLDGASRRGSRHSNLTNATDPRTGRSYTVREYVPDVASDQRAQFRRFITVAKSLRTSPVRSERVLFAYTRNGRCYTVADPVPGTPLPAVAHPGRTPEPECLARLGALLLALRRLHGAGAGAGPFFHGRLRLEDIVVTGSGAIDGAELLHSLYLDNLLRETPLPPEHFQQQDLTAAADIVLALATGPGAPAERAASLHRVSDPLLGAALEYLYGMHGPRANTARAALDYIELLRRAAAGRDRALFQQAAALSPSPRLHRFTAPPAPAPQQVRTEAPTPPISPPPAPVQPPPVYPSAQIPYTPVPTPPPTAAPGGMRPGVRKRSSGCGGCLVALLLAFLVTGAIVLMLLKRPPTATSLDLSAEPNPAPHKAHVQLRWSSSGFDRLELDGRRVRANGSLEVIATASRRYTIAGIRPDGSREIREVDVTVLPRRPAKPAPGTSMTPGSDPPEQQPAPSSDLQEVDTALGQWTQAMLSNDPDREADCYAPELDRYFLQSGVTQEYVRSYLAQLHERGNDFTQFSLSHVVTASQPDGTVIARFNKEVTLATPTGPNHVVVHSILHLRRIDGSWKITSERDFRGPNPQP